MPYDKTINRLTNGAIFVDGRSLYGKAEEITMPEPDAKMIEHKVLGMNGTIELPTGMNKMDTTIKLNGPMPEFQALANDFYTAHTLMFRGNMENYTGQDRTSQVPYVCTMRGTGKGAPMGTSRQHENIDITCKFSITYCKLEVNGVVYTEIDFMNNIYKVNGVDLLATMKANLGL